MKTVYLTYYNYDMNETLEVLNISETKSEGLSKFKNDLVNFLEYGPDDVSTLMFLKIKLDDKDIDIIKDIVKVPRNTEDEHKYLLRTIESIKDTKDCVVLEEFSGGYDAVDSILEVYRKVKKLTDEEFKELNENIIETGETGLDDDYLELCKVYVDYLYKFFTFK